MADSKSNLKTEGSYFLEVGVDFFHHDEFPRPYYSDVVAVIERSLAELEDMTEGAMVEVIDPEDGSIAQTLELLVMLPKGRTQEDAQRVAEHVGLDLKLEEVAHPRWAMELNMKVLAPSANA